VVASTRLLLLDDDDALLELVAFKLWVCVVVAFAEGRNEIVAMLPFEDVVLVVMFSLPIGVSAADDGTGVAVRCLIVERDSGEDACMVKLDGFWQSFEPASVLTQQFHSSVESL